MEPNKITKYYIRSSWIMGYKVNNDELIDKRQYISDWPVHRHLFMTAEENHQPVIGLNLIS